jgi:excisionase family DNA binding protein
VEAPFMTIGEVADVLGISVDRVRQLERAGQIRPLRTSFGWRLFETGAVHALRERRQRQRQRGRAQQGSR